MDELNELKMWLGLMMTYERLGIVDNYCVPNAANVNVNNYNAQRRRAHFEGMTPDEARTAKRKWRKLWRQSIRNEGIKINQTPMDQRDYLFGTWNRKTGQYDSCILYFLEQLRITGAGEKPDMLQRKERHHYVHHKSPLFRRVLKQALRELGILKTLAEHVQESKGRSRRRNRKRRRR